VTQRPALSGKRLCRGRPCPAVRFASARSGLALLALVMLGGSPTRAPAAPEGPPAVGSYAVVVSRQTHADHRWRQVCATLVRRYDATLVTWADDVRGAQPDLAKAMPNYTCLVARPEECGRDFIVAVHRLMRHLDADPYTDTLWGILTGYDADDAARLASFEGPLVLKKVLSGTTGGKVGPFDAGAVFDEGKAGRMRAKAPAGPWKEKDGPADSTKAIVDYLNDEKPDAFITSGHATQRDWQIGYSYKDGQLRCKDGQLFGRDTKGTRFDIRSPNPKVFLPVGNCLIGDVPGRDCMVTALIHTGGVVQMFGYTVPTWYGKGGWGIQDIFLGQPGRWTLAEAFFVNTQAMLHEIRTRFPKSAAVNFGRYDLEKRPGLLKELQAKHGITDRDELGLLWDRDTVAFYGNPALDARPAKRDLEWNQTLSIEGSRYTLTLKATRDGKWPSKPIVALLPHRIANPKIVGGTGHNPVVTDNFIMVPLKGEFSGGDQVKIVFDADRAAPS